MKKSIVTIILMLGVCAGFALSQTKRKPVRRPIRKTVVKKTTTPIKPMIEQQAITTASGLTYIVTKKGDGAPLKAGDEIIVNYTGLFTNGTKFDSSFDPGREQFSFPLGAGGVIKGWDEGFQKLRVGDHATLIIPPTLAYGEKGRGGIPPNTTLVFIVEVIGVK